MKGTDIKHHLAITVLFCFYLPLTIVSRMSTRQDLCDVCNIVYVPTGLQQGFKFVIWNPESNCDDLKKTRCSLSFPCFSCQSWGNKQKRLTSFRFRLPGTTHCFICKESFFFLNVLCLVPFYYNLFCFHRLMGRVINRNLNKQEHSAVALHWISLCTLRNWLNK